MNLVYWKIYNKVRVPWLDFSFKWRLWPHCSTKNSLHTGGALHTAVCSAPLWLNRGITGSALLITSTFFPDLCRFIFLPIDLIVSYLINKRALIYRLTWGSVCTSGTVCTGAQEAVRRELRLHWFKERCCSLEVQWGKHRLTTEPWWWQKGELEETDCSDAVDVMKAAAEECFCMLESNSEHLLYVHYVALNHLCVRCFLFGVC